MASQNALRTPDSRFANLPDFPYEPKYLQIGDLRMAYIDESNSAARSSNNPADTEILLCLHGQPTWSYLYRRMIPIFLNHTTRTNGREKGRRVICPDLFGFGRSDKPVDEGRYTFNFHRDSLLCLVRGLELDGGGKNVALVVQDWGGLLGLTLPMAMNGAVKRLLVMNTTIAVGQKAGKGFEDWRAYNSSTPDMDVGRLISRGTRHLSPAEIEAYNAPYPTAEYKSGVRRFPNLVMTDPGMEGVDVSRQAVEFYASGKSGLRQEDVFMAVGMKDPVLGPPVMRHLAQGWGEGCLWMEVEEGGHFVQEWGAQVARKAVEAFEGKGGVGGELPEGVVRVGKGGGEGAKL